MLKIFKHLNAKSDVKALIRSRIQDLYSWILRRILSRSILPSQNAAIVFAPHQDDETLGAGGMIALKRAQKIPVTVVFIADGHGSHQNHPRVSPQELVKIRQREAVKALTMLGVEPEAIHFLNQPDGSLPKLFGAERQQFINQLVQLLQTLKPQEVYVPYRQDRQPDHEATYTLVQSAILESDLDIELWQYPVWILWRPWRLDWRVPELTRNAYRLPISAVLEQKRQALEEYRSQYLPLLPDIYSSLPPNFFRLFLTPYEIFFKSDTKPKLSIFSSDG